jgi:putative membrane protein
MLTRQLGTSAFAALVAFSLAFGAAAQTPAPASKAAPPAAKTGLAKSDQKFIEDTAAHGMAEVALGKLAQQKATSDQVKQFGARMEKDHSAANEELKKLASAKGVTLPTAIDKKHQKAIDELSTKTPARFDHEYMEAMVKDHKKDVSEFRRQSKSAKDADVRNFAAKTLPTLEEHLKLAQDVQKSLKGKKTAAAPGPERSSKSGGSGYGQ